MKRIFYGLLLPIIILGIIAFALNLTEGNVINFLHEETIPNTNLKWIRYDTWGYINNLKNSFRSIDQFTLLLPTRTWEDLDIDFWEQLGNNLALILDYIIMVINILLYPFRIGFYFLQIILNIIGISTLPGTYENNPLKWLIEVANTGKNLAIPYV